MQEDNRTLKTYLRRIARHYHVDLPALRASTGELLDCSNNAPLTFHRHLVFIPVKVRKPLSRSDGATGFVNLSSIEKVVPAEANHPEDVRCYLQLKSGHLIPSLHYIVNVKRRIRQGQRALTYYLGLYHHQETADTFEPFSKTTTNKKINFSRNLIFKLITDDDDEDDGNGGFNPLLT